jgi:hypothetical protein
MNEMSASVAVIEFVCLDHTEVAPRPEPVHSSKAVLSQGEAEINRIGQRLRAAGRL